MEPEIQPHLPTGSPILAYGQSKGLPIGRKFLALLAGIFVIFCVAAVWTTRAIVRFPDRVLAFAAINGSATLPTDSPLAWTIASSRTTLPKIIGVALTDQGPEPFALVLGSVPKTDLHVEREGAFAFVSVHPLRHTTPQRLGSLLFFFAEGLFHPAYVRIDPSVLNPNLMQTIQGRIDKSGAWITDVQLPTGSVQRLPSSDIAIDLTAFPDAWPEIQRALLATGFPLDEILSPTAFGWSASGGTPQHIELAYEHGVPTSTALTFAAAAGIFDQRVYKLPGDVIAQELRTPTSILSVTSSKLWDVTSGTQMILSADAIALQSTQQQERADATSPCSDGRLVFSLKPAILQDILSKTGLSSSLLVGEVSAFERGGHLVVCTKY